MKSELMLLVALVLCAVQAQVPSMVAHSARHGTATPRVTPSPGDALPADSLNVRLIGRLPNPAGSHWGYNNVEVVGDFVYLSAINETLYTVNVADPANPVIAGKFSGIWGMTAIDIDGDYGYSVGDMYFRVLDVSDPENIELIGACYLSGPAQAVKKFGNYVYAPVWQSGLDIIDVSDPANPEVIGNFPRAHGARSVVVLGDYAYVASADRESLTMVRAIDVSDPENPVQVDSLDTYCTEGIDSFGSGYVVVGDGTTIPILDVSDPANLSVAGMYDPAGYAMCVDVSGTRAYVATSTTGLLVLDVSNPASPQQVGHWFASGDTANDATAVAKKDDENYTYMLDWNYGLQILQFYGDTTGYAGEEGRRPSAFSSQLTATIVRGVLFLTGDGRRETANRAALLDVAGRRVMELQPGPNDVQHLSPGVYFVSSPRSVGKVVLTR